MILRQVILVLFVLLSISVFGQTASISGKVTDGTEVIPFANVALVGTSYGSVSDESGRFEIKNIPNGKYQLQVSSVGFRSYKKDIEVIGKPIDLGTITLLQDVLGLEEVVVTGTMKESFVTASPVKVEVITDDLLEKAPNPVNLVKSLNLINGVQEVVSCGVCYTNNISINGLPGQYTAVLIDGSPIYGNLASIYGLNGIPRQAIDRIEIIKGPNSTLYGSEAMAGVINIITKNPANQPMLAADIRMTSHLETFGNLTWSPKVGEKWNAIVGANYGFVPQYHDDNGDGFGDIVNMDRVSALTKWTMKRKDHRKLQLMAKYYYEDRRNGVRDFMVDRAYQELRGNDSIYGESIYTHRGEVFGTYQLPTKEYFRIDFSGSYHDQDSYYGDVGYVAEQYIAFGNFIWNRQIKRHDLLAGLTARYQCYDDNTLATVKPENQFIPGIFVQDEWEAVKQKFTVLGGIRVDYYEANGPVVSPRLNLKWKPAIWTTIRANFGTGFKVVNLFTEDHAFVTGQREVVLAEKLKPEQSCNGTLSFNQVYTIGNSQGTIDVDGFYTYFTNKIIPDYDTDPQQIIYANSNGHAQSWCVNAGVSHLFKFPLSLRLGFSYISATETENGETSRIQFAPEYTANGTISYTWKKAHLDFAYTGNLVGPMALPEVFDVDELGNPLANPRPTTSKPFYLDVFQITYTWNKANLRFFAGVENIAGYVQRVSPLSAYNDPNSPSGFSPYFDTSYAYSPVHGREFYGGIAWELQ
jgi:outer membrane receptor for ferrienterochelin and colicins